MAKTTKSAGKIKRPSRTFGSHMSIAGGCDRAVRAAQAVGFETVQLFTKNNNQWNAPPLTDEHVAAFRRPSRRRDHRPGRAHLVPDQPCQPRRRPLGKIDRSHGGRGRAVRAAGHPRPGRPSRRAHGCRARRAGLMRIAKALDEVHRRTKGLRSADRPRDDGRPGDEPGLSLRASRRYSRPRRSSRSAWASAWILAIFSRRAIPWRPRRSTMKRSSGSTGPWGSSACASGT